MEDDPRTPDATGDERYEPPEAEDLETGDGPAVTAAGSTGADLPPG